MIFSKINYNSKFPGGINMANGIMNKSRSMLQFLTFSEDAIRT